MNKVLVQSIWLVMLIGNVWFIWIFVGPCHMEHSRVKVEFYSSEVSTVKDIPTWLTKIFCGFSDTVQLFILHFSSSYPQY